MMLYLHEDLVEKEYFTEEKRPVPKFYVTNDLAEKYITKKAL